MSQNGASHRSPTLPLLCFALPLFVSHCAHTHCLSSHTISIPRYEQDHCTQQDQYGNCVAVGGGGYHEDHQTICDREECDAGYQMVDGTCYSTDDKTRARARTRTPAPAPLPTYDPDAEARKFTERRLVLWQQRIARHQAQKWPESFVAIESISVRCLSHSTTVGCAEDNACHWFDGLKSCFMNDALISSMCKKDKLCRECPKDYKSCRPDIGPSE
jgi:hypothetical protein